MLCNLFNSRQSSGEVIYIYDGLDRIMLLLKRSTLQNTYLLLLITPIISYLVGRSELATSLGYLATLRES